MKNKLLILFWSIFSIPSIIILITLFYNNLNNNLVAIAFIWFFIQTLITPIFFIGLYIYNKLNKNE